MQSAQNVKIKRLISGHHKPAQVMRLKPVFSDAQSASTPGESIINILKISNFPKNQQLFKPQINRITMEETITISKEEYEELLKCKNIDTELIKEIAEGIKDIVKGNIKEI